MSILTPESFVLMQVQVALFFAPNSEKLDDNDKFYELTKEMGIKKDTFLKLPNSSKNIPFLLSQTAEKSLQVSEERMDLIYQNLDLTENKIVDFKDFLKDEKGEISKFVELGTLQGGVIINGIGFVVDYIYTERVKSKFNEIIAEIKENHLKKDFGEIEGLYIRVDTKDDILKFKPINITQINTGIEGNIDQNGKNTITGYNLVVRKDYNLSKDGEEFTQDQINKFFKEFGTRCFKEKVMEKVI
jgi:hypothetical protein